MVVLRSRMNFFPSTFAPVTIAMPLFLLAASHCVKASLLFLTPPRLAVRLQSGHDSIPALQGSHRVFITIKEESPACLAIRPRPHRARRFPDIGHAVIGNPVAADERFPLRGEGGREGGMRTRKRERETLSYNLP
ncbi:hypothetical protein EYF80_043525 [Liparis tanakae]|uniref:Uncharacterized protein n=1 Tax=Liparis tanakae TaxID=230148 RepID=A0A4Z2FYK6_9TELE|nr:hypothetical protein EYF80_043525 [Liparis tanakae]